MAVRWVRFHNPGMYLDPCGVGQFTKLEVGKRTHDMPAGYVVPEMYIDLKTSTLVIGCDRIPMSQVAQYRV